MPKEELLQFEGLVTEILPDARYRVLFSHNSQFVASSGSFFINNPKSGLVITIPDTDDKFHV